MREPAPRSLFRLAALAIIVLALFPALLLPGRTAHADAVGTASVAVMNPRIGLVQVSGSGFPQQEALYLYVSATPLTSPTTTTNYLTIVTNTQGVFSTTIALGVFLCGQMLKLTVSNDESVLAETTPLLVQCPVTAPALTVTGIAGNAIDVLGSGFDVEETVAITVSSVLTGFVSGTSARSDASGRLSAAVPLGVIGCGDTLTLYASGQAGSQVISQPFLYSCAPDGSMPSLVVATPSPTPTATSTPVPAGSATQPPASSARLAAGTVATAHLLVRSSPPALLAQQWETLRVETGVAAVAVTFRLTAQGRSVQTNTLRTNGSGVTILRYKAALQLPAGRTALVRYTIDYRTSASAFHNAGTFLVRGG